MTVVSDREPSSSRDPGSVAVPGPGTPTTPAAGTTLSSDEQRLHELGYAQELHRGMGWFSNFAVSFTIISILTGILQTFYLGLNASGPWWPWPPRPHSVARSQRFG